MVYVVSLAEARDARRFGPKAASLAALHGLSRVRVPAGFAIDAMAFRAAIEASLPASQWPAQLLAGSAASRRGARLEAIRQRFVTAPLPALLRAEVSAALAALGDEAVAVRSSALHEDAADASAAGLQETFLGVRGLEAVLSSIARCFASIYQERAMTYLARLPATARRDVAVAVVVQRMVRADVAGVLFTVDPVGNDPGVMVVEAAPGLGCSVVDGGTSPDVFRVSRATRQVSVSHVAEKKTALRVTSCGVLERTVVSPEARHRPSLTETQLDELVTLGEVLERAAGAPRDVEWAIEDGVLWTLQSRPVVGSSPPTVRGDLDDPATWVWSNVNVGEALPGVATPLTWSIASAFSDKGFRRAFGALGCRVPEGIELVGSFHGRIYLNLTNFMRIARQVPVFNPKMLLEFGGGGGLDAIEAQVAPGDWGSFLLRLPLTGARYLAENAALDLRIERLLHDFQARREALERTDLRTLAPTALGALFGELLALLDRTGEVMLTCASGYLSSVVMLRALLRFSVGQDADRFERELLSGISDLESAMPGVALFHIAEIARGDAPARAILLGSDPIALRVTDLPLGPTRRAFDNFLRAYGFRCPREAELATPRWRESPATLFAALRALLERVDDSALRRLEGQHRARAEAEAELHRRVAPIVRSAARHLLQRTWRFSRLRERMRARVTEALGFLRIVALEASRRMERSAPMAGHDGAFHLTADELRAWLSGELGDPTSLVTVRRAQVMRDMSRPDPPPTFVGVPPVSVPTPIPNGDRWTGVAASRGVVTGTVRVLRDPSEGASLRPGEVLVTAVADVGWTPLFLVAAAVVTELGGALSHAALVAREYGVPAVANVSGITRVLKTGDRVRVDGDHGVVERMPPAESTAAEVLEAP